MENFRNKKSKQYIKSALRLNRKKHKTKRDKNAHNDNHIDNVPKINIVKTIG